VFTWEAGLHVTVANARPQHAANIRAWHSFFNDCDAGVDRVVLGRQFDSLIYNFLVRIALIPIVAGFV